MLTKGFVRVLYTSSMARLWSFPDDEKYNDALEYVFIENQRVRRATQSRGYNGVWNVFTNKYLPIYIYGTRKFLGKVSPNDGRTMCGRCYQSKLFYVSRKENVSYFGPIRYILYVPRASRVKFEDGWREIKIIPNKNARDSISKSEKMASLRLC